jgi:EmrB/QacA subfamily drug resistance transporter
MARGWKILFLTSIGAYLVSLDVSILNVAFRALVSDFGQDHERLLAWVFSGYNVAFAAALLTAGRLADRFGRKRAFLAGLATFAMGSLLCGVAPSPELLVAARVVQAVGGAFVLPASLALVLPEFPVHRRSAAIGVWGAVGGVAAATGPSIGGLLVAHLHWRAVFFFNLPFCAVALAVGARVLAESREADRHSVPDVLGALLAVTSVGVATLVIIEGDTWGWVSAPVLFATAAASAAGAAALRRCRNHPAPVLDLRLLRLRYFTAANIAMLLFGASFFAGFFANTQFLLGPWHYPVSTAGLLMTPGPIMAAIVAAPAGRQAQRGGHRQVAVTGIGIYLAGTAWLLLHAGAQRDYLGTYLPSALLAGTGIGMTLSTLTSASNAFLPADRFAMGSAFNATMRQVGAAIGVAAVVAVGAFGTDVAGFRRAWLLMLLCGGGAALAMAGLYRAPTAGQLALATTGADQRRALYPVTTNHR